MGASLADGIFVFSDLFAQKALEAGIPVYVSPTGQFYTENVDTSLEAFPISSPASTIGLGSILALAVGAYLLLR